jgi:prepilin-type processing-associated H-X9-DG protein
MSRANGAFNNQYQGTSKTYNYVGDKVRLDDFKDGQGNTILYSENVQALPWHRAGYLDTTDMSAGIDLKSKPRVEDIPNTPEVNPDNLSGTELALAAARYTNGMVWHYEDPDYQNMNNHVVTHVACRDVDPLHKINGRGTETGEDIFTLEMEEEERTFIDLARPSSAHSGGVNVALADGSVKFITDSIDYRVYQALLTPRGKSSNVPWPEFVMTDEIE